MNDLSHKVLDILLKDCRTPLEDISVMLGEDSVKIAEAIDKLQKDGVILKYASVINWDKTDRQFVEAIIEVKVTPQKEEGFDSIAKQIYQYEEVRSVFLVSGMYDLLILAEAPTLKELALFVSEKLSVIDFVTATSTSFVLKRYKQDGVIFEIPTRDKRLLVSP